jgi:succinate dehydrogenase / fumarate reductase flavoprotein subunit
MMGGVRVHPETQMSSVAGLFAAGESAGGLHGANRLGGNSLSDLLVFGKRAGEHAASFARTRGRAPIDDAQIEAAARDALAPLERQGDGQAENPYRIQGDLQVMMQKLVGIVRRESEMLEALDHLRELSRRARQVAAAGNREYNPGWHTALDLEHLLTVSEAITRAALERKESRGAQFRDDHPDKDPALGRVNIIVRQGGDGAMQIVREPVPQMTAEQKAIVEANK